MEKHHYLSMSISLNALMFVGWWAPRVMSPTQNILHRIHFVTSFMLLMGVYLIIQIVDLYKVWGNLPLMTGTAFLLFTNLAHTTKIVNVVWRKHEIQRIIGESDEVLSNVGTEAERIIVKRNNREATIQQVVFFFLTTVTVIGWAGSAEKNQLPLRAWYPYDTSKSPAYELTYCHQVGALFVDAYLNVAKDTLVTTLASQCRCRLELINYALKSLHSNLGVEDDPKKVTLLTQDQENKAKERLKKCVKDHQAALQAVADVQRCFSAPIFAQFAVSLVIICVTAFQMASQLGNPVRLASMTTYLLNMSYQVFIYCYQGEQLREESTKIAGAAYESIWYRSSVSLRRSILHIMVRSRRPVVLNAGGFTNLSLQSFMAIIKASYSFFTVLQQIDKGI